MSSLGSKVVHMVLRARDHSSAEVRYELHRDGGKPLLYE